MRLLNTELADTLGNLLNRCCGTTVNALQQFPPYDSEHYEQYCQTNAEVLLQSLDKLPGTVLETYISYRQCHIMVVTTIDIKRLKNKVCCI